MNSSSPKTKFNPMSVDKFYQLIQSSQAEVSVIFSELDKYYSEKLELKIDGKTGLPKIKNGNPQFRRIRPSNGKLKFIQSNLQKNILANIKMPEYVQGSVKKRSNVSNASRHYGNKYFFLTDLKNFFPSIPYKVVYKTFCARGFSSDVAHLITKLTTYKGTVPQGIPTSSTIANLVFLPIDKKLLEIIHSEQITYTRYVDDLTFSSKIDFKNKVQPILETIEKSGFRYSHRKTNYKTKNPIVTGILLLSKKMTVTKAMKEKLNDPFISDEKKKAIELYIRQVEGFLKKGKKKH